MESNYAVCTTERRNVAYTEKLIADLSITANALEQEISHEEARTGITDPKHFAYPMRAKAAILRRDNLRSSVEKLEKSRAE